MAERLQMDLVEVLNFFFFLGSCDFGVDYDIQFLTDTQMKLLQDLRDFGIVYQRKKTSNRFYPTRLATTLTSGVFSSANVVSEAFIVVETNYRIYAYTSLTLSP